MLQENEFILETKDREVAEAIFSANIDGVSQHEMLLKAVIDPEPIIRFVISAVSDVSIGLFSAWLYDLVKKRGSDKTSIQGQKIPHDVAQIITVIQVTIENNEAQANEHRQQVKDLLSQHDTKPPTE